MSDLVEEIRPEIEEAYKITVCGYSPLFGDERASHNAITRWTQPIEVWLPVPRGILADLGEPPAESCRKLMRLPYIQSARFIEEPENVPEHISARMGRDPMLTYVHVLCVPFKDLVLR